MQKQQMDEDKMAAEFYETQNRLMKAHKEYYKNVKWYGKWVEKVWAPFMKKKQEERNEVNRKATEEMQKHMQAPELPATSVDPKQK